MNYFIPLRLIGVVMLLISFLSFVKDESYFSVLLSLFIALVFLLYSSKSLQDHFDVLTCSFKEWRSFVFVWLIDLSFVVLLFISLFLLSPLYSNISETFENVKLEAGQGVTGAVGVNELLKLGIAKIVVYVVIIFVVFFMLYTLSRALMWGILSKKKFGWNFVKKFFVLNLLWWFRWVLVFGLTLFLVTDPSRIFYALIILILLYNYFTLLLHYSFSKTMDISKAFKNYLVIGRDIKRFIVPLTQALIILLVLLQIYGFIPFTRFNPVLFVALFLSWFRSYMNLELNN